MKYLIRFSGFLLLALAWYFYYEFTYFEEHGGTVRSHTLVIMMYDFFGKWGVVSMFGAGALALFYWSGKHLVLKLKGKVVDGKNPNGSENLWN